MRQELIIQSAFNALRGEVVDVFDNKSRTEILEGFSDWVLGMCFQSGGNLCQCGLIASFTEHHCIPQA